MNFVRFNTPTERFTIDSYGNGWAYRVTDNQTNEAFFVQDEAASQLQSDTADFTGEYVLHEYMEAFGEVL